MAWKRKAKAQAPADSDPALGAEGATDPASVPQGELLAVVREWNPQHDDALGTIHAAIDHLGHQHAARDHIRPVRDYAEIEAAVDRITKRVKSRQVVVEETVTEYVDVPADAIAPVSQVVPGARNASLAPPLDHKPKRRLAWFGPKGEKQRLDKAGDSAAAAVYQAQCGALTADGAQCRNSSRDGSKYCASHKGYQPPTTRGVAKRVEGAAWDPNDQVTDASTRRSADTRPRVRRARDTKVATRKARRGPAAKRPRAKSARSKSARRKR